MPAGIRIYFEGDKLLKPGSDGFVRELKHRAREKRSEFRLVSAKSGEKAPLDFETPLKNHPETWSMLLRDGEGPVPKGAAAK